MNAAVTPLGAIRPMTSADLAAVAAVERDSYRYPWSEGIFRDCLLAGYSSVVLDVEGQVVGYGIMSVAAAEAHILNLCVHPSYQRCGYGRSLLHELLTRARAAAVKKVFLEVRPSNYPALALYAAQGFKRIGIRPGYYQAEQGREDAVILAAALPKLV